MAARGITASALLEHDAAVALKRNGSLMCSVASVVLLALLITLEQRVGLTFLEALHPLVNVLTLENNKVCALVCASMGRSNKGSGVSQLKDSSAGTGVHCSGGCPYPPRARPRLPEAACACTGVSLSCAAPIDVHES